MRISSGAQPIPQEPGDDSGGSSGSPLTFSISLKSSSNLVPSAPPTFSLTSCGGRTGEGVRHCLDIPSSRWDTKGTAILAPRRGHEQPKALKKNPPNIPEHPKRGSGRMFLTHQELQSSQNPSPRLQLQRLQEKTSSTSVSQLLLEPRAPFHTWQDPSKQGMNRLSSQHRAQRAQGSRAHHRGMELCHRWEIRSSLSQMGNQGPFHAAP